MWTKIILLLLVSSVLVDNQVNSKVIEFKENFSYRLPNDSIPIRYDIWLKTDVDKKLFDFSGRVKIHIKIVETTHQITLQHRELIVDKVDLLNLNDKSVSQSNLVFTYDNKTEFLKISLPNEVAPSEEILLDISYKGTLRNDDAGFYKGSYRNEDREYVYLATTQFESTDARHAMPCYDEPAIRAVMGLQIQHGKSYNAISNMPIISRNPVDGTDYVTSIFEDTPIMQTYLLAFTVSDYIYISNKDEKTEQRVYGNPKLIGRGEGEFAIGVIGPILRKFEEHLNVTFPLPKLDHAAFEDFAAGAMENFGYITYKESYLLCDKDSKASFRKQMIIETIAHEIAHQYFGNIVSPEWWTYTFLNEGFATLYSYYILDMLYPGENHLERLKTHAEATVRQDIQSLDSKPMSFYVAAPKAIKKRFKTISYRKASLVLRMFQEAFGVPTFTKGINYYINNMYYKAANPGDLHRNLQKAYDEDFPGSGLDIDKIMVTWENQAGYPLVSVKYSNGQLLLTQERFKGGNEVYSIPISYATKSAPNFDDKTAKLWMTTATTKVPNMNADDWIILNFHDTGYYKVSYGNDLWRININGIKDWIDNVPTSVASTWVKDFADLLEKDEIDPALSIQVMSAIKSQTTSSVWKHVKSIDKILSKQLFGTKMMPNYQKFMQSVIKIQLDRLGFDDDDADVRDNDYMRMTVVDLSCKHFQTECLNRALKEIESNKGAGISKLGHVCNGLRLADKDINTMYFNKVFSDLYGNRWYLSNLGCSLNPEVLKKFLDTSLDWINSFKPEDLAYILEETVGKSTPALDAVLEFLHEHFNEIEEIIPDDIRLLMIAISEFINDDDHYNKMETLIDMSKEYLTKRDVKKILATMDKNKDWLNKHQLSINELISDEIESV